MCIRMAVISSDNGIKLHANCNHRLDVDQIMIIIQHNIGITLLRYIILGNSIRYDIRYTLKDWCWSRDDVKYSGQIAILQTIIRSNAFGWHYSR